MRIVAIHCAEAVQGLGGDGNCGLTPAGIRQSRLCLTRLTGLDFAPSLGLMPPYRRAVETAGQILPATFQKILELTELGYPTGEDYSRMKIAARGLSGATALRYLEEQGQHSWLASWGALGASAVWEAVEEAGGENTLSDVLIVGLDRVLLTALGSVLFTQHASDLLHAGFGEAEGFVVDNRTLVQIRI
ncbi:MAG: histidine phosphatase family protein [Candidatus Paceibacterota bacterium]